MISYTFKYIVDNIWDNKMIINYSMIFLLLLFTIIIMKCFVYDYISILKEKSAFDISQDIQQKIYDLGITFFETQPIGETLSLFTTGQAEFKILIEKFFPDLLRNIISIMIGFCFLSKIHYLLAVVVLLSYLPFYLKIRAIEYSTKEKIEKHVIEKKSLDKIIYDAIISALELRINGSCEWMKKKVSDQFEIFKKGRLATINTRYKRGVFYRMLSALGISLSCLSGYYLFAINSITLGDLVASFFLATSIIWSLNGTSYLFTEQSKSIEQVKVIMEFLNREVSLKNDQFYRLNLKGNITFSNVSFSYSKERKILKNISFNILSGEKVAIVGETGSGKSTIVKLISGIIRPCGGEILYDGLSAKNISFDSIRNAIAYIFQENHLWNISIDENISLSHEMNGEQLVKAAKTACIHDHIVSTQYGYKTVIEENGRNLSGGEKQRISIARGIYKSSPIIIIDESFSSLDKDNGDMIRDNMLKMDDKTIICVEHNIKNLKSFDKILVIKKGSLVEQGKYEELIKRKGEFYSLIHEN